MLSFFFFIKKIKNKNKTLIIFLYSNRLFLEILRILTVYQQMEIVSQSFFFRIRPPFLLAAPHVCLHDTLLIDFLQQSRYNWTSFWFQLSPFLSNTFLIFY